jgi:peptidoglycan/xylan/chitin deacetylase (PgdA/CDA1 family)
MFRTRRISRREFIQESPRKVAAIATLAISGEQLAHAYPKVAETAAIPDKLVVLSFDDAVKSQRTFVAPFLKELGFGATFFVSHRWMPDHENFMTWDEIAEISRMGFEIGNHTWTHGDFSMPRGAAHLAGELALVERALAKVGVAQPLSFAWPGDAFGPEAVAVLEQHGYQFARRGMQPEIPYGEMQIGPTYDPTRHHPLLIPTTGDSYPDWTPEYFQQVVAGARDGKVVVLQFHGVPDLAHPWVCTFPENFTKYMAFLKENGYRAIALGDLKQYVEVKNPPVDPVLNVRYPQPKNGALELPTEVVATRADLRYWLENMLVYHRYTLSEAAGVCGMTESEVKNQAEDWELYPPPPVAPPEKGFRILPYPGGRYPRIGFQEGAIDPMRGTKASVFLPWDPTSYVVVDLPEAIFCNLGLIFLAHTDIPTIWDDQNVVLQNIDWNRELGGALSFQRTLPTGLVFGAAIRPREDYAEMELWIRNFGGQDLHGFQGQATPRAQVCVMLKGAKGFNQQTNGNKILRGTVAAVRSAEGNRWILTTWEHPGRLWGNPRVPCMHADPHLPACPFGQTVRTRGRLWFYEGTDVDQEFKVGSSW